MESAQEILVVMLSVFLAIFLALGIALLVLGIKIARKIQAITEKAEHIVDKAENIGEFFKKASGPLLAARLISRVVGSFSGKEKNPETKEKKRR